MPVAKKATHLDGGWLVKSIGARLHALNEFQIAVLCEFAQALGLALEAALGLALYDFTRGE